MIRQTLLLTVALLPVSSGANAVCVPDPPEIGDIGPSSERVCLELEHRFPGAALAVENRLIHSPTAVSVVAAVDGKPVSLRYQLFGWAWQLEDADARTAELQPRGTDLR